MANLGLWMLQRQVGALVGGGGWRVAEIWMACLCTIGRPRLAIEMTKVYSMDQI